MTQPSPPPPKGYTPDQFFTAGGTMSPDDPSYVTRPSDEELYEHILRGDFCYVLTSRQMGKSSLMARTSSRLDVEGIHTAIIDLTRIDKTNPETWYKGLLEELNRRLRLGMKVAAWWQEHAHIGPVQRFSNFLEDVLLKKITGQIVIFIDEIDTTLRLDFSDDFFAAIRAFYNARATMPELNRLTFVLLGVASPADLIKDRTRTPFNIGTGITLRRFSRQDVSSLAPGLEAVYPGQSKAILDDVYGWTNGHPYLTQKLCKELVERRFAEYSTQQLDHLVRLLFLTEQASKEENLQFVRNTLLSYKNRRELLDLYAKVLRGKPVLDDKQSLVQEHLKLSGVVVAESGVLKLHNKLYARAFSLEWVRQHNAINWTPYLVAFGVLAGLVALVFAGIMAYNALWLQNHMTEMENCFYKPDAGQNRMDCLAEFFTRQPVLAQNPYPSQGRSLFFSYLTYTEQLKLFSQPAHKGNPNSPMVVVRGLYSSLAETSSNPYSDQMLQTMEAALRQPGPVEGQAGDLANEIAGWLAARQAYRLGDYVTARQQFQNGPLALNPNNQAVLYEYAVVLIHLGEADPAQKEASFSDALAALDKVMLLAGQEYEDIVIEPTRTITVTETSQLTPSSTPAPSTATAFVPSPTVMQAATATTPPYLLTATYIVGQSPGFQLTPSPTLFVPAHTPTPLPTHTPTPSPTLTPTPTSTSTPTQPAGQSFNPSFSALGEVIAAVRTLIESNTGLAQMLADSAEGSYPSLKQRLQLPQLVQSAGETQLAIGLLERTATLQAMSTTLANLQLTRTTQASGRLEHTATVQALYTALTLTAQPNSALLTAIPTPTPTPTPMKIVFVLQEGAPQYSPNDMNKYGCDWFGVAGQVFNSLGQPLTGVTVEVGGQLDLAEINKITLSGTAPEYGESGWVVELGVKPVASLGTLYAQLWDLDGQPLSGRIYFNTYEDCSQNLVLMIFRQTLVAASPTELILEVDDPETFSYTEAQFIEDALLSGILGRFNRYDPETGKSYLIWYLPRQTESLDVIWTMPAELPGGWYRVETFVPGTHATSREVLYYMMSSESSDPVIALIDQSTYSDMWVPLFTQVLEPGVEIKQSLQTNETAEREIAIGPLRLLPLDTSIPRFDAPVGTEAERSALQIWPGDWVDSNPFLTVYNSVYHTGADLNLNIPNWDADANAPVYAIGDGIVVHVLQDSQSWGNMVVIYHPAAQVMLPDGSTQVQAVYSRYHPLADGVLVKQGDAVVRGQQIGNIGLDPVVNSYYLCFEVSFSEILSGVPLYWPGEDVQGVKDNFLDPRDFLLLNH